MKLRDWLVRQELDSLRVDPEAADEEWRPKEADCQAAWALRVELLTRVATQGLAHGEGDEKAALESIFQLFEITRTALKAHPGSRELAKIAVPFLNQIVRPFTAKWHPLSLAGAFADPGRCADFRTELAAIQEPLRRLTRALEAIVAAWDFGITSDQAAAHQFLTELRTRITTQPLAYQHGVETRVLESLWEVFGHAREAINRNPGCVEFARKVTHVLNVEVRPLTAKWHRAREEGRLDGRDGADAFRGELEGVRRKLRAFAAELHAMAYGERHEDAETPDVMPAAEVDALFAPLPFGFTTRDPARAQEAEDIARDEAAAVKHRRANHGLATAEGVDAIGLALSGGGIRSATFSLGVVQVLAARGLLKEVDFLSTVSGGGYTGCFLTQRLGQGEDHATIAGPRGPDPEPVRYVRLRARFLSASNLQEKWAMVTATLAGMVLNWSPMLLVIVGLALVVGKWGGDYAQARAAVFVALAAASVVGMVIYGIGMRIGKRASLAAGAVLGVVLALTAIVGLDWTLSAGSAWVLSTLPQKWKMIGGLGGLAALVVAALPGILRFLPVLQTPSVRKRTLKIALVLVALLVPLGAYFLFHVLTAVAAKHFVAVALIAAALAVISFCVLDLNLTGPHRMYRDSLSRTFIQKEPGGTTEFPLTSVNPGDSAPYHLINTALNVPSSETAALKDRGCDFFCFSKKWTGSMSTGYRATDQWKVKGKTVDLATAMAVSGAAFSSHMGLGSMPALASLLTFLNVRLGYWLRRPGTGGGAPGFRCLLRETLGFGLKESADWLNLSDGGHIENLGVYELLRRRCKFIVCVDGEADPTFTFHGLMTVVRHAQIDFGVRIAPRLDDLRPDPATRASRTHFAFCRIHYPGGGTGLLLYVKLSVTGNESELIRRYRINHRDFPHQSTLDQFFDQEQFEAYRQLGVHVAEGLFLPALMGGAHPASVPDWFRRLAKNLLEPLPSTP